mgnify:CR=1 FL=1
MTKSSTKVFNSNAGYFKFISTNDVDVQNVTYDKNGNVKITYVLRSKKNKKKPRKEVDEVFDDWAWKKRFKRS